MYMYIIYSYIIYIYLFIFCIKKKGIILYHYIFHIHIHISILRRDLGGLFCVLVFPLFDGVPGPVILALLWSPPLWRWCRTCVTKWGWLLVWWWVAVSSSAQTRKRTSRLLSKSVWAFWCRPWGLPKLISSLLLQLGLWGYAVGGCWRSKVRRVDLSNGVMEWKTMKNIPYR